MPPGSSKKKQALKITSITNLLNTSQTDAGSVVAVAQRLKEALTELNSSGSCPAAHVGAVLQAVAWVCRASYHKHETRVQGLLLLVSTESFHSALSGLSKEQAVPLQQLRPVLRPCREDGGTPGRFPDWQWLPTAGGMQVYSPSSPPLHAAARGASDTAPSSEYRHCTNYISCGMRHDCHLCPLM
jgi:hypothetical protein